LANRTGGQVEVCSSAECVVADDELCDNHDELDWKSWVSLESVRSVNLSGRSEGGDVNGEKLTFTSSSARLGFDLAVFFIESVPAPFDCPGFSAVRLELLVTGGIVSVVV
jgi:hypothetical protein